jgi:hypothetical protein
MALKNMSLLAGAAIAASGGSAQVFSDDGQTIANGTHLIVPADADYQTRRGLTAKFRPPTLDTRTGSYGKDKKSMTYVVPHVLTDGRVIFNTLRLEREVHPSMAAADVAELNKIGAQLLTDDDTVNFWATGSLS